MKDKIIKRIKALMLKTVNKGTTEEEMRSALKMVAKLQMKYDINQQDLEMYSEMYVLKRTVKCSLPMSLKGVFAGVLAFNFDCNVTADKNNIDFYGFRDDVDLLTFLYMQVRSKMSEAVKEYKKTEMYKGEVYVGGSPRTLLHSFKIGFLHKVAARVSDIYKERNKQMEENNQYALICVGKVETVKEYMNKITASSTLYKSPETKVSQVSFREGQKKGSEVEIKKPLNQ